MIGRRYNEGLHQAIEAKEGVEVANESKTLATITFQNFFRLYDKLSGMTGTAMTEEDEFSVDLRAGRCRDPHQPAGVAYRLPRCCLQDRGRQVQRRRRADRGVPREGAAGPGGYHLHRKVRAALQDASGKRAFRHNVLNAKHHEKEAEIVAQAGKLGAVTIATNMAGRGTDIVLGGNAEFLAMD